MERMKAKNLKSLQNIIEEMHSENRLGMNNTFSIQSSTDMIMNVEKFLSSYRKNNRTIDSREQKWASFHPTDRRKKTRVKSIYENFATLDSCKNANKNGHFSNMTIIKSRDKSSVKKQKKNKSFIVERKKLNNGGVNSRELKSPYRNLKLSNPMPSERRPKEVSDLIFQYERNWKSTINRNNRKRKAEKLELDFAKIKAENSSKVIQINMLKSQVDSLTQKLAASEDSYKQLEEKYTKAQEEIERLNALASNLYQEYALLAKEKDNESMQSEIDKNHMETKIRLLKEVLTK